MAIKFSINKIVLILIKADFFFFSALGLVAPIFAVFLTDKLQDGSLEVAGFAAAIYLDKKRGERDDLIFLIVGYLIVALAHFAYTQATLSWHIYIIEAIYAFGMAMAMPGWSAIFTRHIDKGKEGFEWSIEHVAYAIGMAVTSAVGGVFAARFGFNTVFIIAGIIAMIGALLPLIVYNDVNNDVNIVKDRHPKFLKK